MTDLHSIKDKTWDYRESTPFQVMTILRKYGYGILDRDWEPISTYAIERGFLNHVRRFGISGPKKWREYTFTDVAGMVLGFATLFTHSGRQELTHMYIADLNFLPPIDRPLFPTLVSGHPVITVQSHTKDTSNKIKLSKRWTLEVYGKDRAADLAHVFHENIMPMFSGVNLEILVREEFPRDVGDPCP